MNTKKQLTMLIMAHCCILLLYQDVRAATESATKAAKDVKEAKDPSEKAGATKEDIAAARILVDSAVKGKKSSGKLFTQTQAHLSLPITKKKIKYMVGIVKNKDIITKTQKKELSLKDYYVFYTAIPYMRLVQDVVRKMYKNAIGNVGGLPSSKQAFQFLRFTNKDSVYNQYKNATDFLTRETKASGLIDDEVKSKTILVSANLALFGNIGTNNESTWYFFNNPQPWSTLNRSILESALKSYDYSVKFVPEIMTLLPDLKDAKGNLTTDLFQIFIPKATVNEVGYLSWRLGIPFDTELIPKALGLATMTFGPEDKLSYLAVKEKVTAFRTKYQNNDPEARAITDQWLTNISKGKYHLSTFLDKYKSAPTSLNIANAAQARLLITNTMLLNPASGILIYRYSMMDPKKELAYKQKLNEIFKRMEAERQQRRNLPSKPALGD